MSPSLPVFVPVLRLILNYSLVAPSVSVSVSSNALHQWSMLISGARLKAVMGYRSTARRCNLVHFLASIANEIEDDRCTTLYYMLFRIGIYFVFIMLIILLLWYHISGFIVIPCDYHRFICRPIIIFLTALLKL